MWDLSFLKRDWTHAPLKWKCGVSTMDLQGRLQGAIFGLRRWGSTCQCPPGTFSSVGRGVLSHRQLGICGRNPPTPPPTVLLAPQSLSVGEGSLKPGGQHAVSSSELMLSSDSDKKSSYFSFQSGVRDSAQSSKKMDRILHPRKVPSAVTAGEHFQQHFQSYLTQSGNYCCLGLFVCS